MMHLGAASARAFAFCAAVLVLFHSLIKSGVDPKAIEAVVLAPALAASSLMAYAVWRGVSLLPMILDAGADGKAIGKAWTSIWTPLSLALSVMWWVPMSNPGVSALQLVLLALRDLALRLA